MRSGSTELVFLIDRSGSMGGLEDDTIGGFNAMLKEQQSVEGEAVVTTVLFDDQFELLHDRLDIQTVAPLTREDYTVRGGTALLDAIGMTIHRIRRARRAVREASRGEKVMFIIITDGYENASRRYTADMIRARIEHQRQKHGWEFLFFGANMDAAAEAGKIGIAADRARNYQADALGTQSAYSAVSAVSTAFRTGGPLRRAHAEETPPPGKKGPLPHLKAALGSLKKSADGLAEALTDLSGRARSGGGEGPGGNAAPCQERSEQTREERT